MHNELIERNLLYDKHIYSESKVAFLKPMQCDKFGSRR